MTKTLTEQWKDGKIKEGFYYVLFYTGEIVYRHLSGNKPDKEFIKLGCFQEVLAPVPSYDEVKDMSQKIERLEFDNEALEMAHNEGKEINAELVSKNKQLEKKLEIALEVLGIIAMHSKDTVDAVQAACAISQIKEMEGVK